jgi:two-component system, OmpR family, response regulator
MLGRCSVALNYVDGLVKVLVVEDDRKLARLLQRVLTEEGCAAELSADGEDALARARAGRYDLIVLDWMIPGVDGLEVCRELRRGGSTVPILMLTARGEVSERVLGLNTGADDYLVKPFEVDELVARVNSLIRRASGQHRVKLGALEIDRVERRALLDGKLVELTAREFSLLLHLALRRDRVVTRAELLAEVWSTQFDPESNVVEVHVSRLRDKLGEHAWMIDTVRGRGYRMRGARER